LSSATSATARLFHWLTALLVVVAYIVSVGGPEMRVYSAVNDFSRGSHELLGMSVFALTMARVCWRTIFPSPKSPEMPAWMEVCAKLGQWALYALLVLVPSQAIVGRVVEGHPLTLLPWVTSALACAIAAARPCAGRHSTLLGECADVLAGLHATARSIILLAARHVCFHVAGAMNVRKTRFSPLPTPEAHAHPKIDTARLVRGSSLKVTTPWRVRCTATRIPFKFATNLLLA